MIIFNIIGDAGSGTKYQLQVADALYKNIKNNNSAFAIGLGDNIYKYGCESVEDEQFITKFEVPYEQIPNRFKFYMTLGNHDHGNGFFINDRGKYQIEYGRLSHKRGLKWVMPYYYYSFSKKKGYTTIDFFVIDTNIELFSQEFIDEQYRYISNNIRKSQANWKILVGHHTFRSVAGHGNADYNLEEYLKKIMKLGINVYMCGHDHNKQLINYKLGRKNILCIVCGSGGKQYNHGIDGDKLGNDSKLIWNAETLGFATLFGTPTNLSIKFYDETNGLEYVHKITKKISK